MTIEALRKLVDGAPIYRPELHGDDAPMFKLLSVADIHALPPVRWRVRGVLPEVGFGAIYGASGSGKSFLVIDMVAALHEGRAWFGYRCKPCRVLYVVLEGQAGVPGRIGAWETTAGRPFPDGVRFMFDVFRLLERAHVHGLADAIAAAGGADVVIVDTLNRAAPGADENGPQDSGRILDAMRELQSLTGGLVLVVHHSGKVAAAGMRGHSSLFAAMDAVICTTRMGDAREWTSEKVKDGAEGKAHPFKLLPVHLGDDEHGEPITSCAVQEPDPRDIPAEMHRITIPRGGNQRIIYDALAPLLRQAREFGQAGAPAMRPCITLEEGINGTRDKLAVEPKRRTERARQAITGLIATRAICANDGWLWLP